MPHQNNLGNPPLFVGYLLYERDETSGYNRKCVSKAYHVIGNGCEVCNQWRDRS